MRLVLLALGLLSLSGGGITFWLNGTGHPMGAPVFCRSGMCSPEDLKEEVRALVVAGASMKQAEREQLELLSLDAASPYAWMDTAVVLQAAGDPDKAEPCARRAEALGPHLAPLQMRVLHFELNRGSREGVLRVGKTVLGLTRDYDDFVFTYYEQLDFGAADILGRGMPKDGDAPTGYLSRRLGKGDSAGAAEAAQWMMTEGVMTERGAETYSGYLLKLGEIAASRALWDSVHTDEGRRVQGNLLYNPGFARPFARGPYDWTIAECAGVQTSGGEGGVLQIEFLGERNVAYHHVSQMVLADPGTYRFVARVKAEELSTNEGVAIRLRDREVPARFTYVTPQVRGTTDWMEWASTVVVPHGTRLLEVSVIREPSTKLDNRIRGIALVKGLSLRREGDK
jgi:hypothetical protein